MPCFSVLACFLNAKPPQASPNMDWEAGRRKPENRRWRSAVLGLKMFKSRGSAKFQGLGISNTKN